MGRFVEHSGGRWESLGIGPHGRQIWPIEEYLARTDHPPDVIAKLKRLNPNGKEEGEAPNLEEDDQGFLVRRVAIVGLGPKSHDLVPWQTWEAWGLPWDAWSPRYSRLFEMHDRSLFSDRGADYLKRLREADVPIYMQRKHEDIPQSVAYPLAEVVWLGRDYFGSSIAYMLGLAVLESADEVGLWGVDLHDGDGYDHQRPNVEWWIGLLEGEGIKVTVHESSALLTHRKTDKFGGMEVVYPKRYGYL